MSSFTFNGVSSDTLGIIITKPIIRPSWAPETEFTPVPGRPRQLPHTKEWYPNKAFTVKACMADASPTKVQQIYNTLRGYGTLVISTSPNEQLNVYVEELDPEGVALLMAEFPITFNAEPFANAIEPKSINVKGVDVVVNNEGTAFVDPLITIIPSQATTSVICNGKTMTVNTPQEIIDASYASTYSITLDCEGELAYYTKPDSSKVGCTQCTQGPFPRIGSGLNSITIQNVQSAALVMRERWY